SSVISLTRSATSGPKRCDLGGTGRGVLDHLVEEGGRGHALAALRAVEDLGDGDGVVYVVSASRRGPWCADSANRYAPSRSAEPLRASPKKAPKAARSAIADLQGAAAEIQDRLRGGPQKRSAAAKKAARTRQHEARKRSAAAKKAARSRAKTTA